MSRQWTDSQAKAINARGMQVLVSAAAGSGKTSVLTERVKQILSDTENKCYVSEILVVTFTRAAANEMRERIYKALRTAASQDNESSEYLRSQMTLLPTADICTIDSFCAKIVRENFHLADVGADFNILDDKDNAELMKNALEQVINELYEEDNDAFKELSKMFLNERDDSVLEEVITSLYNYSRSYPSPFLWLDSVAESFSPLKAPDDTSWAESIYKFVSLFSDFYCSRLNKCVALMEAAGDFNSDYFTRFTKSAENLTSLKNAADNRNWDAMITVINGGLVVKNSARTGKCDEEIKAITQDVFKEFEEDVKSLEKRTLPTVNEHKADCERLYPVVGVLCDSVKRLTALLDEAKKEKNAYSFDDILHKCIDLLVVFDKDGWVKTPLAEELSANYKEILIDEYQDTNEAQNIIFDVLSKDKSNLYVVGDVKQSIYRFRLASPELFMNLKNTLTEYDNTVKPSQITLENNFRSRKGVTEAVNFIFKRIMSTDVGEIDYNEKEFLYYSASFPDKETPDTTLVCLDSRDCEEDKKPDEPEEVAKYIKSVVQSGAIIGSGDNLRKVTWGDFCILLRSTKNKAQKYADALRNEGIPVTTGLDGDAQDYKEIQFLTSLVSVINNPLMDIPLIAVLMSPVFGFTADELAEIRVTERKTDMFVALTKAVANSPKIKAFIDKLQLYRNIAAAYPVNDFVRFIVDDTAVSDIYYSAGEGEQRKANVKGFIKLADDFVQGGRNGLTEFVRYMENATQNGGIKSVSNAASDENSVKIMSIHKSKGLEFPYVIIADCSKRFNRSDSYGSLTVARETGLGLKIRDDDLFTRYHTVSSAATEKAVLFGDMSEELRVLYVAMTRAKEHLVFFCDVSSDSLCKRIRLNNALSVDSSGRLHPYAVYKATSMSEWLLSCFAVHRDCGALRKICAISQEKFEEKTDFAVKIMDNDSFVSDNTQEECAKDECACVNDVLLKTVTENISYSYPYDFSGIIAKRTASSMETNAGKSEYFATKRPAFLSDKFTGAQRGTAIHKFLELCDFHNAADDIEAEKSRLLSTSLMNTQELDVLDEKAVVSFLGSSVGKRLLASNQIYKEYEFSILKTAGELYDDVPELAENEQIVVQGKLDCAFVENGKAILIDYKTDNITDEDVFVSAYAGQLSIYAQAMEECTGLPVSEIYIYSFKLKKFICVKESSNE